MKRQPSSDRPGPVTCLGCGAPGDLLRIAWIDDHGWTVDERGRLGGAGVSAHARRTCIAAIEEEPERLGRELGRSEPPPRLHRALLAWADQKVIHALSRAAAAGQLLGGQDRLVRALRSGEVASVVVAADPAPGTIERIRRAAPPGVSFHTLALTRAELGARIGQPDRAAVGFPPSHATAPLRGALTRRAALVE